MGIYKKRSEFIDKKIIETSDSELKKLLSNGFIPDELTQEYEEYISGSDNNDEDFYKITNGNYFAINKDKQAGKSKKGSGFLNPVLIDGKITDAIKTINNNLQIKMNEVNFLTPKIEENILDKIAQGIYPKDAIQRIRKGIDMLIKDSDIETYPDMEHFKLGQLFSYHTKRGFSDYYEEIPEFIKIKLYRKFDFNTGFAEKQINQHLNISETKKEPIIENIEQEIKEDKQAFINKDVVYEEITPTIEVEYNELEFIVENNLIEDDFDNKVKCSTQEIIDKYNVGITDEEIIAWVWYKRQFGNPMKGWEKYFLSGGNNSVILVKTIKETIIKDNYFRDIKLIPANTILGKKTKFSNTYGSETHVVIKTDNNELVMVNIDHITEIKNNTNETEDQLINLVEKGALFFDGNEYTPIPVFLFGDLYKKIAFLKEQESKIVSKFSKELFDKQIDICLQYKPKMLSFRDPVKSKRPHILSLSEFANDTTKFGVLRLNDETNIKLGKTKRNRFIETAEPMSLFEAFETWMTEYVKDIDLKNTTKEKIRTYYFAKSIRWEKDEFGEYLLSKAQRDELVGNARIAAELLFSDFLASALTYEDSVALDNIWNEKYNTFTKANQFVNKIPIGYTGSSKFKKGDLVIMPAQRHGLAFLQLTGSGCLSYDVGFGKTLSGILNLAQLMSQGKVKRALIVVPKPTYKNWIKELFGYWTDGEKVEFNKFDGAVYHYGVFSGTNVKFNDWYNLSGNHLQELLKNNNGNINKLVEDNSITLLSYPGFSKVGLSKNLTNDMFESIARVIMQKDDNSSPKEAAKLYEKIIQWVGWANKESIIDIDICGFDHLTVDEAHNFKNVFDSCGVDPETKRKLFGMQASQSGRGVKMFFVTQYMQRQFGKNVVLLTATPFTNSPLEMYSMLSFIGLESLNEYNLYNIKKFFESFVLETIEYAVTTTGEIVTKSVIKSFMNLKLLQTILYNCFDYKDNPKEANVVRPCLINLPNNEINTYLTMNEWQVKNQQEVKLMAKSVSRSNKGAVLKAISMSLDNAFSPYLFAKEFPETAKEFVEGSPKIMYVCQAIKTVKDWHENRKESCSGIVIYSNRGKEYFESIKEYLIDVIGFKRKLSYDNEILDEVEIISGGGSEKDDDRKELIKDAFNFGVVKIIIGTSTIREGINLQSRSTCLFDLYPEWNPSDIKQLKGRIHRQGNMYGYVRFVMPLVVNSMDSFINQKQSEKTERIASLWNQTVDSNIDELSNELNPNEIKYELVDDAEEKFKIKYEALFNEANKEVSILNENSKVISSINYEINSLKESASSLYADFKNNYPKWTEYYNTLKDKCLDIAKQDENKRMTDDIKRVIEYIKDLISKFNAYEDNKYDIALLIQLGNDISRRNYYVFTNESIHGRQIKSILNNFIISRLFSISDYQLNRLKSYYSTLRKAEKTILNAYGKSWHDDISDIQLKISDSIEKSKAYLDKISSEEYNKTLISEIQKEIDAKKLLRGDIETQVSRFASQNYIISYLGDNTDRENCPIPIDEYTEAKGIDIIYEDKELKSNILSIDYPEEIIQEQLEQEEAEAERLERERIEQEEAEEFEYEMEMQKMEIEILKLKYK